MVIETRIEAAFGEGVVVLGREWMNCVWGSGNILFLNWGIAYTTMFSLISELSPYVLCTFLHVHHASKISWNPTKVSIVENQKKY